MIAGDVWHRTAFLTLRIGVMATAGLLAQAQGPHREDVATSRRSALLNGNKAMKLYCLTDTVKLDDIVTYGLKTRRNITVKDKLVELRAHCKNNKLVDGNNKEIRFYKMPCWGNPPADYEEIQRKEQNDLRKLQQRYTVVLMGCNPSML